MSEIALSGNIARKNSSFSRAVLWSVLAGWFALVLVLGSNNFFVARTGGPPLALLLAATAPIAVFLFSVSLSAGVREFALSADLRLPTAVQAWRFAGYSFLVLYSYGHLPGYFAWPAGVGDMLIGMTAPLILARITNPGFIQSRTFVVWNVLGILDLIVAIGMGALGSVLMASSAGIPATTIMSQMPLVLIPTFFVPVFLVLHLIALLQARRSAD